MPPIRKLNKKASHLRVFFARCARDHVRRPRRAAAEEDLGTECSVAKLASQHYESTCARSRARLAGADGVDAAPLSQCVTAARMKDQRMRIAVYPTQKHVQ